MRLPNIQLLRACAALMIVVHHCGVETGRLAQTLGQGPVFNQEPWGSGVSIFFAISGFIMVVTTVGEAGSTGTALDFMRRRIIRIVPIYWVATTIALAAALAAPALMKGTASDHGYVLSSYLFWPWMRADGEIRPIATPGWSLNLEMFFYIVFAVCLTMRRRTGMALLFVTLAGLVVARSAGLLPGVALNFWGEPVVLGFVLGAAVGVLFNAGWRLPYIPAVFFVATGFAALFMFWIPSGAEEFLLPCLKVVIPSALILIGVALGPQTDERDRIWVPALLIGDASYSLYLVHEFLLRPLTLLWRHGTLAPLPLWVFIPLGLVISVVAALASYRWFERPVTRWLNANAHLPAPTLAAPARFFRAAAGALFAGEPLSAEGRADESRRDLSGFPAAAAEIGASSRG